MRITPAKLPQNFWVDWLNGFTTTAGAEARGRRLGDIAENEVRFHAGPGGAHVRRYDSMGRPRSATMSVANVLPARSPRAFAGTPRRRRGELRLGAASALERASASTAGMGRVGQDVDELVHGRQRRAAIRPAADRREESSFRRGSDRRSSAGRSDTADPRAGTAHGEPRARAQALRSARSGSPSPRAS